MKPDYKVTFPRTVDFAAPREPTPVELVRKAFIVPPPEWPEPDPVLQATMTKAIRRKLDLMTTLAIYGFPLSALD